MKNLSVRKLIKPGAIDRINPSLEPLIVLLADVKNDTTNARQHDDRSVAEIANSLSRFGQQKPVVIDTAGTVRAGNGTVLAARRLGWTKIAAVRSDLPLAEIKAFAIADNRTAELSEWNDDELRKQLAEVGDVGFNEDEVSALLEDEQTELTELAVKPPPTMTWALIGIPTVRFGEIAEAIEQIGAIEGVFCETAANNDEL